MREALRLVALTPLLLFGCQDEGLAPNLPNELLPLDGEVSVVVLPDTQGYTDHCPQGVIAQADWIARYHTDLRLALVAQLGDLTEHNRATEWDLIDDAFARLDGLVPYSVLQGNHDLGVEGDARDRSSLFDTYFPVTRFGSSMIASFPAQTAQNQFHRVATAIGPVCLVSLEFAPRTESVEWARAQLAANTECLTVLTTHAYLFEDGERYDARNQTWHPHRYGAGLGAADGERVYQELVRPFSQVRFVLSGHTLGRGVARRVDVRSDGTQAFQILSNYQELPPCGGNGYLRLMSLSATGVRVKTYSPYEDRFLRDSENEFELTW